MNRFRSFEAHICVGEITELAWSVMWAVPGGGEFDYNVVAWEQQQQKPVLWWTEEDWREIAVFA